MKQLITFFTQAGAIRFEKELRVKGITSKLKPVPRQLSSSCGLCVEVEMGEIVANTFEEIECCYKVKASDYELIFQNE
jgi:hypothetical protein